MKKRLIKAEDLYNLRIPTSISISPDERQAAFTVEWMNQKKKEYYTNIHLLNIASGKITQFTHGNQTDGQCVWSPDGATIAFVSTRQKKTVIYIMPVKGGAEQKLIEIDGSISNLQWTPNSKSFVFALRYNDSHYIKDEKEKKEPPVFRHITRFFYQLDGEGFLPQDRFHIYMLDIATNKLTQLTRGKKYDDVSPAVSPDGRQVAFISNHDADPDFNYLRQELFIISIKGGKVRKIKTPLGPKNSPKFSPNGKFIAYIGHDNPEDSWGVTNEHIWLVGVGGNPKARDLMPTFDRMTIDQTVSDTSDVHEGGAVFWSGDSKRIYFVSSDTGNTNIFYIPRSGGRPTRVFRGDCHVKGFAVNGRGNTAALIYADLNNPGDIMTCPAQYGGEKRAKKHTDLNPWLKSEVKLGKTTDVVFKSSDGTEVQGFLVKPPFFNKNKKYPAILEIHGGPRAQYAFTFFHEMQFLAANGYVVFYTNPRGGSSRGETWAAAIEGGWGDLDFQDCMAAADYIESLKYVNKKRIGVTGGSYGGYMTNWMIGKTNRFKAAVTQRSVTDLTSMTGSSDIGFMIHREFDGFPWTNPECYRERSPNTHMENVKTPVLIIHSEKDLRCPLEQAQQMYTKLKVLKKKVEMVMFPDSPHGLSRHGRPDRRLARLNWIVKWFKRWV